MKNICIRDNIICIGKEKFSVNGKVQCCKEEMYDEYLIAQSVIDAIEDCALTDRAISRVCSRLSYAADCIGFDNSFERTEILPELKRFAILAYHHKNRILMEKNIEEISCSFIQVVKQWFTEHFIHGIDNNSIDSIKADLRTLEMALGICVILPEFNEDLDDIFF